MSNQDKVELQLVNEIPLRPEKDRNNPNYKTPSQRSGWLAFALFLFELPTVLKAYKLSKKGKSLDEKTLPGLAWEYRAENLEKKIAYYYEQQKRHRPKNQTNFAIAVIKATKWEIIICHVLEIAFIFLRVFSAYCCKKLLDAVTYDDIETYYAYIWAAILAISQFLSIYVEHHMYQLKCALPLYVRGALISMVYSKVNKLSVYTLNKISLGKIINIVANDLNIFETSGLFFSHLITGVVGLIGGTALVWIFFNFTVLLGIGFMLLTLPIQHFITSFSVKPREKLNHVTDNRVKITSELLEGIRLLKMYTWELIFKDNVKEVRREELALLKYIKKFDSVGRSIAYSTHALTTFLIFMLYSVTGGTLRAPEVFATHFLFTFMRKFSAIFVGQGIVFLAEANILLKRLAKIIDAPEIGEISFAEPLSSENAIEFNKFSASWGKDEPETVIQVQETKRDLLEKEKLTTQESKLTLVDININIKTGSLNALVGKVGAGKSSLLLSLTGEMPTLIGDLRYRGTIAYVEQEPTIFAGTIREGILFGRPYDAEFYQKVIKCCNLESDLKLFPNGDLSEVGERGNNLSGGQKARLALARAVYSNADIYLLDDPLSAVDTKVAKSLYNDAIKGLLGDKTVILATHQIHFVKDLENIMIIDDGKIVANGSYRHLKEKYADINKVFPPDHHKDEEQPEEENAKTVAAPLRKMSAAEVQSQHQPTQTAPATPNKNDSDDAASGRVTFKTYGKYLKTMGNFFVVFGLFAVFLTTQFANVGYGRILAAWATGEFSQNTSLAIAGGIAGFILFIYLIQNFVYNYLTIRTSKRYHDKMLDSMVRNPVTFFDMNPLGRILNRFSNDIGTLDSSFAASALDALDENAIILSLVLALVIMKPWTLLPVAAALVTIALLIKLCYPAIEQSRSYELVSRSPLSSQFSSTLSGLIVIRSYKQVQTITEKFRNYVNNNTQGSVGYITASRFFAIYVDVFYTIAATGNTYIVTALGGDPGLAAFALMLIISVTGAIQFALRQLLQAHILMSSSARVQAYCEIQPEAQLTLPQDQAIKKSGWPQHGQIDFNKVYMKYRPELDFVLKDLTLHAKPGEKIGCIGRTGAGKSTIIQILFRMIEIDRSGDHADSSYIKIDEADTQNMGLHLLRDNIAIIPQVPFCFSGTVKKNLDPLGHYTDQELWTVLEDVNLKAHVEALENGLDTDMTSASSVFSVGQKQLICLARTILKKSKMLVLDEATANVDIHTDDFIQEKIREKFSHCTIFTIAHRLTTIANYDKVLVLDKGRKIEYDHPYRLLVQTIGDNTITKTDSLFASMILNTGPKTSEKIFKITKKSYEEKFLSSSSSS